MMHLSRAQRGVIADWWWTVDRWMMVAILLLIVVGMVLSLAASPAVANRLGFDAFHFVYRQAVFIPVALVLMFSVSLLTPRQVRRLAAIMVLAAVALMVATLLIGQEINGAHRWLNVGGFALQPSEFVKPGFVVLVAWLFAEDSRLPRFPGAAIALALYGLVVAILACQPDFGQVMLLTLVFSTLFFMAGLSWAWITALASLAIVGAIMAYLMMPHVASRVDRFIDPESGDTYQTDRALDAFQAGGFFGTGPGEGHVKRILPDAHTDFIFAVAAEEFGVIIALCIIGLFAFIVVRPLMRTLGERDRFVQLAVGGLAGLFGLQALINMAVNVNMLPAKGMTLPFISYGGSSMLALALGMGMLLALTRRRAGASGAAAEAWGGQVREVCP